MKRKGFTLIELLVVVGIIAVLAIAALVAINPAEAQRKSRDATRLHDMTTLQTALEQFVNDNPGALPAGWAAGNVASSQNITRVCDANWTALNLCPYLRSVPIDPINRNTVVTNGAIPPAQVQNMPAYYYIRYGNGTYKLCTYLESTANGNKLNNAGANPNPAAGAAVTFATGSDMTLTCP